QHVANHGRDPSGLLDRQTRIDRNLDRLRGATGAVSLGARTGKQLHVGRHVDVKYFDVDSTPHAAHHQVVALDAFGTVGTVLIVDVGAAVRDEGGPYARQAGERTGD